MTEFHFPVPSVTLAHKVSAGFGGDACGVGLIAATDGAASRRVVSAAIDALKAVWHRGAVDADGKTGDGAGLHVDLPARFFDDAICAGGHVVLPNRLAVGMVFLPRTDLGAQETCRTLVEAEIIDAGYMIYGWRQVPVDVSVIGARAQDTRQLEPSYRRADADEAGRRRNSRRTLPIRRRIEKADHRRADPGFYICQLSCPVDYLPRGCSSPNQLSVFYPDLMYDRFESRGGDLSTSAIQPTLSRNGGWRSRSGAWRIMARSTPFAAIETG
ncbi:MAG: hypothetical protein U5J78_00195 [Parasphingorhabdus sp.]|nr:hypothetical protein [Parasphingorhabdus sp.]